MTAPDNNAVESGTEPQGVGDRALRDALTGVGNRRAFEADLAVQVARCQSSGERSGLVLIDLDRLRDLGDTYGIPPSDAVLKRVADVLTELLRPGDRIARVGGDEFAILLAAGNAAQADAFAAGVRQAMSCVTTSYRDWQLTITGSVGLVLIDDTTTDPLGVIADAYCATRAAKAGVGDRRSFDAILEEQVKRCRRDGERAALVLIGLDGLAQFDERHGWWNKNPILRAVAAAVTKRLRAVDQIAWIGGDEFAIVLIDVDRIQTGNVVAAIEQAASRASIRVRDEDVTIAASVGYALIDETTRDAETVTTDARRMTVAARTAAGGIQPSLG